MVKKLKIIMKTYMFTLFLLVSLSFLTLGEVRDAGPKSDFQANKNVKQIKSQGEPVAYEKISLLLKPLSVVDKNLFDSIEKILKTNPLYSAETGVGLDALAEIRVYNANGTIGYIITMYNGDSKLISISIVKFAENRISYTCEHKGWYRSEAIYTNATACIVNLIRDITK